MRALIAVVSCTSRPLYREAIRETWFPLVPADKADAKFFVGRGGEETQDTVVLNCDDSYEGLPDKVRAIARWALDFGYTHVLKCDDDVVLDPVKLLNSGYDNFKFVGHRNDSHETPVPPYGFCYWLSREPLEIIATSELPNDNFDEGWVRTKLFERGITLHHDPRYFLHFGNKEDYVSKRRPPRAPMRPEPPKIRPVDGTFAWCMYLAWLGYRNLPTERVIQEFKRVFSDNVKR